MAFTVRLSDDDILAALDTLAAQHGLSRNAFIEHLVREAVATGFVPLLPGEGYRGDTGNGGFATLMQADGYVAGGRKGLDEAEESAFQQALELAQNTGDWPAARRRLLEAGFQVTPITANSE